MGRKTVLNFGEPSIDHIILLDEGAGSFIDPEREIWKLTPETFFAYTDLKGRIAKIMVGRKWDTNGHPLEIREKDTLSNKDTGFVELMDYDESIFESMRNGDKNAITGFQDRMQPGGPLRNSLERVVLLNKSFFPITGFKFNVLYLGGLDEATTDYMDHMNYLNSLLNGSTINTSFLIDEKWATHEAFNILPHQSTQEELGKFFRTLIRYQEKRQAFSEDTISRYFFENQDAILGHDYLFVNSLKVPSEMSEISKLLKQYGGRVIVAPTDDMYKKSPQDTKYMLERADRIVMNIKEAALITGNEYKKCMTLEKKAELTKEMMRVNGNKGTIIITDDKKEVMFGIGNDGVYYMKPPTVDEQNHVNAGDVFTGTYLASELVNGKKPMDVIRFAVCYTSCYVGMPHGTKTITPETMAEKVPGWQEIPIHKINGYSGGKSYHSSSK